MRCVLVAYAERMTLDVLVTATREVIRGRSVVPVGVAGPYAKRPDARALIRSGNVTHDDGRARGTWLPFQSRRPTLDEVWTWFVTCGVPGVALVTGRVSGVIVLDFDGDAGGRVLERLNLKPHVQTPSGGFHCWLEHPGWSVPTLNSKVHAQLERYRGLDIRADGGLAVMPPTRTRKGAYLQLRELKPDALRVLPDEVRGVLGLLRPPVPVARRSEAERRRWVRSSAARSAEELLDRALELAVMRGRNEGGFRLACTLRDHGYSQAEALEVLARYASLVPNVNGKGQREPYTAAQYTASVRSAYRRPARVP